MPVPPIYNPRDPGASHTFTSPAKSGQESQIKEEPLSQSQGLFKVPPVPELSQSIKSSQHDSHHGDLENIENVPPDHGPYDDRMSSDDGLNGSSDDDFGYREHTNDQIGESPYENDLDRVFDVDDHASSPLPSSPQSPRSRQSHQSHGSDHINKIDEDENDVPLSDPTAEQEEQLEDSNEPLPAKHDWTDLVSRFEAEMAQNRAQDAELEAQFEKLMAFYNVWRETCVVHEEERAAKRLRTRIAYVEHTETELTQKRAHYDKVTQAFQRALDLLDPDEDGDANDT